jgi:prepilin-type N-terminal cleavage/methylation domain-containing protein
VVRRRQQQAGFTLLETMAAMLVAAIGLLGTVAFQAVLLSSNAHMNDGAVALRLASQGIEEIKARSVVPGASGVDQVAVLATGNWTPDVFLGADGQRSPTASATARWQRRLRVTDPGFGQPYLISVQVQYSLDTGSPKQVQLDQELRK